MIYTEVGGGGSVVPKCIEQKLVNGNLEKGKSRGKLNVENRKIMIQKFKS